MSEHGKTRARNEARRLARLSEAVLRASKNLDLDSVLREVAHSARSLTGARYGAIITAGDSGAPVEVVISGLEPEAMSRLLAFPHGTALLKWLRDQSGPLRTPDFVAHTDAAGFPGFQPLIGALLGTTARAGGRPVGYISVAEKPDGAEFTSEDEETLEMFAAQAATAITNARRHGDEQRARAGLEALIDTSPVGVLVVDARTQQLVRLNPEARRILGEPADETRALDRYQDRLRFMRMDGSEIPRGELPVERSIGAGETVLAEEVVIERPDGSTVSTLVSAAPIRAGDGEIVSVVATAQDVTPLEELQRLRCELLGMVSHELRAPLTSIKGSAATMRDTTSPLDPAEVQQFLRMIEEQADHMRDLIGSLLDMTRIEAGTLFVSPAPADVASMLDQARNAFLSSGHGSIVEIDVAANLPRVWADTPRIVQVLNNLFANVAGHSRQWSVITVTASMHDQHVAIGVTDQGAPAAPHRSRPFATFPHPRRGVDGRTGSSGLGLAICEGIVKAHGGRIWTDTDNDNDGDDEGRRGRIRTDTDNDDDEGRRGRIRTDTDNDDDEGRRGRIRTDTDNDDDEGHGGRIRTDTDNDDDEGHGGRIRTGTDGDGRRGRITFTIPAVDEASTKPAAVAPPDPAPVRGKRILAVDGDPSVLRLIRKALSEAGYTPILTGDPDEVEQLLRAEAPHLVLLDSMLPGSGRFELIKRIRGVMDVPVILLSGRADDPHLATVFETGATDFVVKPFSPTELLARISAALRRGLSQQAEFYRLGDLTVDFLTHTATLAGRPAKLTPTEFKLLFELCTNGGRVLSYEQLLERVWNEGPSGDPRRVRTFVKGLRQKLGDDARNPTYILTVPGVGYRSGKTPLPAAP